MNNKIFIKNIWQKINKNTYIFSLNSLEECKALILSKTSRYIKLEKLVELNENENIYKFSKKNNLDYKQASIIDLINISVFSKGFGWISSWLLKDDPLFNGQEISTRSISIPKIDDSICFDCPKTAKVFHKKYLKIFKDLSKNISDVYDHTHTYDDVRWCLPGTIITSTSLSMSVRVLHRHLEKLKNLSFMKKVVKNYFLAMKKIAPNAFKVIQNRSRKIEKRWILEKEVFEKQDNIKIKNLQQIDIKMLENFMLNLNKREKMEYLDSSFNQLGIFKLEIVCSILSARSFHRHRTLMPWCIKLLIKDNKPFLYNHRNLMFINKYEQYVEKLMIEGYKNINENIDSLYHLPLGTAVKIVSYGTLPNIIYMLELRAFAKGSNIEYASICNKGIECIRKILGEKFCNYFNIITNIDIQL